MSVFMIFHFCVCNHKSCPYRAF